MKVVKSFDNIQHDKLTLLCVICENCFCFCLFFLEPRLWHMEIPRLGVELEQ